MIVNANAMFLNKVYLLVCIVSIYTLVNLLPQISATVPVNVPKMTLEAKPAM